MSGCGFALLRVGLRNFALVAILGMRKSAIKREPQAQETPMPSTPGKLLRGAGRVAFLARIEAIGKAISEGYTLTVVYNDHQKHLGISYSQFARYVSKFISQDKRTPRNEHAQDTDQNRPGGPAGAGAGGATDGPGAAVQPGQPAEPAAPPKPKPKPGQRPGFNHDPDASSRSDLI